MSPEQLKQRRKLAWGALLVGFLAVNYFWLKSPITIAFDPNDEKCIPDIHLSLLVKQQPGKFERGDLVFWEPSGPLAYIKQEFVMKRVSGIEGDHLQVKGSEILINGSRIAGGLPLVDAQKVDLAAFERDEIIPAGHLFMTGTHPLSNDSRYWGYLDSASVVGKGYKIF